MIEVQHDIESIKPMLRDLRRRACVLRNDSIYQSDRAWRLRVQAMNAHLIARELTRPQQRR